MEKKRNSCPMDVCEKIYKAVTVFPAFPTIRRISYRVPHSNSASPASNPSPAASSMETNFIQSQAPSSKYPKSSRNEEVDTVVPINFDFSSQNEKAKVASRIEPEATSANGIAGEVNKVNQLEKHSGKSEVKIEHINPAKFTSRNSGEVNNGSAKRSVKDKFSDYIERTKNKLISDEESEESL